MAMPDPMIHSVPNVIVLKQWKCDVLQGWMSTAQYDYVVSKNDLYKMDWIKTSLSSDAIPTESHWTLVDANNLHQQLFQPNRLKNPEKNNWDIIIP